jgi:hypothetical protein
MDTTSSFVLSRFQMRDSRRRCAVMRHVLGPTRPFNPNFGCQAQLAKSARAWQYPRVRHRSKCRASSSDCRESLIQLYDPHRALPANRRPSLEQNSYQSNRLAARAFPVVTYGGFANDSGSPKRCARCGTHFCRVTAARETETAHCLPRTISGAHCKRLKLSAL